MKFIFAILCMVTLLTFAQNTSAANPVSSSLLGNLQEPIKSLGALAGAAESLQKRSATELGKLIDENDCTRKIVLPDEQPPLTAGDMKLSQFRVDVSGPGCPVIYSMSLDGVQTADGFQAKFQFQYRAQTAEAKKLYDIDETSFAGALDAKVLQTAGGGGIEFDFKYDGGGNSQTQGPFKSLSTFGGKMEISTGSAPAGGGAPLVGLNLQINGQFQESLKFDFKNESAEMASVTKLTGFAPSAVFTVNGKKVTEVEYKSVRDLIQLPGLGDTGMNAPQGPSTLECRAEVYRASEFSIAQAQKWIQSGGVKPVAMKSSKSCGGTYTESDMVNGLAYGAKFTSEPSHTSIRVEMCEGRAPCGVTERMFLPDETESYADEILSRYTVITSCAVVPACVP